MQNIKLCRIIRCLTRVPFFWFWLQGRRVSQVWLLWFNVDNFYQSDLCFWTLRFKWGWNTLDWGICEEETFTIGGFYFSALTLWPFLLHALCMGRWLWKLISYLMSTVKWLPAPINEPSFVHSIKLLISSCILYILSWPWCPWKACGFQGYLFHQECHIGEWRSTY